MPNPDRWCLLALFATVPRHEADALWAIRLSAHHLRGLDRRVHSGELRIEDATPLAQELISCNRAHGFPHLPCICKFPTVRYALKVIFATTGA